MAGGSYHAAAKPIAATRRPPALKAVLPGWTASECYEGWIYQGGAFQLGFALMWAAGLAFVDLLRREARGEDVSAGREALEAAVVDPWTAYKELPLAALPAQIPLLSNYGEWLAHPDRDDFWRATAINQRYAEIDVPALHVGGWSDIFFKGTLENYVGLRDDAASEHARPEQRLW